MKKCRFLIIVILFILVVGILFLFYEDNNYKYYNDGLLYINEVMASNKHTVSNKSGNYADYIELYNGYDEDINLKGYYLSDKDNYNETWQFPDVIIKANSYLLVFASGDNTCEGGECNTNFKLSSNGGVVSLTNKDNVILSKIKYEETEHDTSYGYNGKEYVYYYEGTPGIENIGETSVDAIIREQADVKLRINEYTNNNISIKQDSNQEYYSIIELYNYDDEDINLEGFHLSNSNNNPNKYTFGDITIKKGEYLLVYLSGKSDSIDNEIHTNFTINTEDKMLVLTSNKGELIEKLKLESLSENMIASLYKDEWLYSYTNTFGEKNIDVGSIDILQESNKEKTLIVTEVSSNMIEIKNITNSDINLKNYGISGNGSYVMKFPDITIKANSYLTLNESDNYSFTNGILYTGFKINNTQEEITLYDSNNAILDTFISGKLSNNISYGINNDGERVIFGTKTLGYDNSSTYYTGFASSVNFSIQGGYVEEKTEIELSTGDGSEIYYTLDGSFPNRNSIKYDGKIVIDKTTTIKAISYKDGCLESDIVSRTYFVGRKHNMAVVSISTDWDNLYSNESGILVSGYYNNYKRDWERKISFEFYEEDGSFGIMFNGGTKLTGQDSREFPQKSMAIYLRSQYGINEITYPFFEDHDVTTFSSFTLRNSGEDVTFLKFKDAYLIEVLKGQMDLDYQYYRPVVVYINGTYYGIYNIREKINESYLANNHGVDEDNVDLIKGNNELKAGSMDDYNNLVHFLKYNNMADQANYDYAKTQIDIQELINYWVVQTYYRNTDTGNIRFWTERTEDGKWRWVLFDLDWSMWPTTYRNPALYYPFEPYGHGTGRGFSTAITYNLYKNPEFRDQYLKTFAHHMKTTFKPERMLEIFENVKVLYEEEMPYHVDRWYQEFKNAGTTALTMNAWYNNIESMKKVITNRYEIVKNNLRSQFKLSYDEYQYYFGDL